MKDTNFHYVIIWSESKIGKLNSKSEALHFAYYPGGSPEEGAVFLLSAPYHFISLLCMVLQPGAQKKSQLTQRTNCVPSGPMKLLTLVLHY